MQLPDWLSFSAEAGLWGLFGASFVSATILPGGSEVVLLGLISQYPDLWLQAVGVATLGNTLGGMSSFFLGRLLPRHKLSDRAMDFLKRYGYWSLLFSWVPLFGDALCVAAGWLRFNPYLSLLLFALGKLLRYALVAGGWSGLMHLMA